MQDLSAMEAQMAELEEEQRKLKQIQSDIEVIFVLALLQWTSVYM